MAFGTRWFGEVPPDWISEVDDIRVNAHLPLIDGRTQAAMFVDYWISRSGAGATKIDWHATWRNWIRNARGPKPESHQSEPVNYTTLPNDRDAYAKSMGFSSWLERQDTIAANKERERRADLWRAGYLSGNGPLAALQNELGVKVREYTPDELASARRQLGIEDTPV